MMAWYSRDKSSFNASTNSSMAAPALLFFFPVMISLFQISQAWMRGFLCWRIQFTMPASAVDGQFCTHG
jgi:hypothetical protein